MERQQLSRRALLKESGAALAGLSVLQVAGPTHAFGQSGEQVIPWLDQPAPNPVPANVGNLLRWEALDSWLTPAHNFFFVNHFGQPAMLDQLAWRVGIEGMVAHPRSLTLDDIRARPAMKWISPWNVRETTEPGWTSSSAASAMPGGLERA